MTKGAENIKKEIQAIVDIYKSGDLSKAELLSKKLIKNYPNSAFLYNLLGLILAGREKIEEAIESYENGIKVDPKFAIIYNNLGLLYFNYKTDNEKPVVHNVASLFCFLILFSANRESTIQIDWVTKDGVIAC